VVNKAFGRLLHRDTAWTDVLIDLAADSDLFIAECYF
jgi:hypothetical protein